LVVDGFEVIQIDEYDGGAPLVAVHMQNRALQLSFEAPAVGNVKKSVCLDSGFELFDL
jgi:hypothetical protein